MTIEAAIQFGRPFAGIVGWLRTHPAGVQQLTRFRQAIGEVTRYQVQILLIPTDLLDAAAAVTQQTGLLHNDSLIVALMRLHGLINLASTTRTSTACRVSRDMRQSDVGAERPGLLARGHSAGRGPPGNSQVPLPRKKHRDRLSPDRS